ncbi:unnamed protein product [Paramecium pentaurelia]|uniref:Transmembrane protein n=1 Tax=Paramecium pentaurelia TaxID=43138 RepID=A0A8S1YJG5_9CILI|nr:unnamed protein product [Paramecium pentaurelia]
MKFNSKNSLLCIGSDKKIKIYAFHKGLLYKIGELYHSNQELTYLNCNKDKILISGYLLLVQTIQKFKGKFKQIKTVLVFLQQVKKIIYQLLDFKNIFIFGKKMVDVYKNQIYNQLMDLIGFTVQVLMSLKIKQFLTMETITQIQFNNKIIKNFNGKLFKQFIWITLDPKQSFLVMILLLFTLRLAELCFFINLINKMINLRRLLLQFFYFIIYKVEEIDYKKRQK